jgi:hypothetical protein
MDDLNYHNDALEELEILEADTMETLRELLQLQEQQQLGPDQPPPRKQ